MKTKTSNEYRDNNGNCCPVCGSVDFQGGSIEIYAGSATQEVFCNECDATWIDTYQLTGYTNLKQ